MRKRATKQSGRSDVVPSERLGTRAEMLASRDEVRPLDPVLLHVEGALAEVDDGQAPLASAQVGDARPLLYTDPSAMPY